MQKLRIPKSPSSQLSNSQFILGAIVAIVGFSVMIPSTIVMYVVRAAPIKSTYLEAYSLIILIIVGISVVQLYWLRKEKGMFVGPRVLFLLASIATVSTGLLQVGAGGRHLIFLPLLFLNVLYFFVVGNGLMRLGGLLVAIAVLMASVYASGLRGSLYVAVVTIAIVSLGLSEAMIVPIWANQTRNLKLTFLQRRFVELGSEVQSIEDALERALPLIAGILPVRRCVAVSIDEVGDIDKVLAAWPEREPGDLALGGTIEAINARTYETVIVSKDKCYLPGGYVGAGTAVIILEFGHISWLTRFNLEDSIKSLVPSFLGLSARITHFALLEYQSSTDPLTGIPNRRVLFERLYFELERAKRSGKPVSVAMIDLDHFKSYNDEFGHVQGDRALVSVTHIWSQRIRGQDLIARFGGEEFCLLMPETDADGAKRILTELKRLVSDIPTLKPVTASSGIAMWNSFEDPTTLLERADRALYVAKRKGRNRVEVAW